MNAFKVQVNVDFNKKPIFTGDKVKVNSLEGPNGEEPLVPESFTGLVELKEGEIYAYDNNYSVGLSNYEIRRCKIELYEDRS